MLRSGGRGRLVADINVTPMADIMIVLLIIFMVMTPLIDGGPVAQLPPAVNARVQKDDPDAIVISLAADATTYLGGRRLDTPGELLPDLQARFIEKPESARVVYIKADERLVYSEVRRVMDLCREAGAEQVALIAQRRIGG